MVYEPLKMRKVSDVIQAKSTFSRICAAGDTTSDMDKAMYLSNLRSSKLRKLVEQLTGKQNTQDHFPVVRRIIFPMHV